MALSGSFTTNNIYEYSVNFSATLSWTVAQSIQDNTSTVSWSLRANTDGTGYRRTVYNVEVTVDGTPTTSNRNTAYGDGATIWSGSKVVTHNNDGTKTLSISARLQVGQYSYNVSGSGSWTLDTIPRASDITVSAYSIANTTGSLSYSVTAKADFYHKAVWELNGTSTTVTLGEINATTQSFTIRNTDMLNKLPTQASGSVSIKIQTYSDSGYATLVGENTASATVTIDTSAIKPTVTLGNLTTGTSPIQYYAIRGHSTVKSSWSVSGGYGTTSRTTYFSVSHGSMQTTTSTSASGNATTTTVPSSTSDYTLTMYAYAKDGRGAVSDTVSKTITVYGYENPTATLTAYRVASSSSTTEDGGGAYVYVTFSGTVNSSVSGRNTIQSTTCTYTGSISGTATNGAHYRLADNQNVTFTLTVTDKVSSSTAVVSVQSASYPLDLYDDGQGNVGGAIGGVAPRNGFAVYVDLHLYAVRNIVIHKIDGTTETHSVSELFG